VRRVRCCCIVFLLRFVFVGVTREKMAPNDVEVAVQISLDLSIGIFLSPFCLSFRSQVRHTITSM